MPTFLFGCGFPHRTHDSRSAEQRGIDDMRARRRFRKWRRRRALGQVETPEQLIARLDQYPRPFPRPS